MPLKVDSMLGQTHMILLNSLARGPWSRIKSPTLEHGGPATSHIFGKDVWQEEKTLVASPIPKSNSGRTGRYVSSNFLRLIFERWMQLSQFYVTDEYEM